MILESFYVLVMLHGGGFAGYNPNPFATYEACTTRGQEWLKHEPRARAIYCIRVNKPTSVIQ